MNEKNYSLSYNDRLALKAYDNAATILGGVILLFSTGFSLLVSTVFYIGSSISGNPMMVESLCLLVPMFIVGIFISFVIFGGSLIKEKHRINEVYNVNVDELEIKRKALR